MVMNGLGMISWSYGSLFHRLSWIHLFRAYIIDTSPNGKEFTVFYIDYGTTTTVKQSDTRVLELDELWLAPPLAVPFYIKSMLC